MDKKNLLNLYGDDVISTDQSVSVGVTNRYSSVDYHNKINNLRDMTQRVNKLGGIGAANVGSKDWEEKMYLMKKRKDYGNQN